MCVDKPGASISSTPKVTEKTSNSEKLLPSVEGRRGVRELSKLCQACSKLCPVGFGVALFFLGRSHLWFSWCRIQQPRVGRIGLQKKHM